MTLKPSAFLETIIAYLMPYFSTAAADESDARSEIIETLASYATRTRAEILQAAQIIALSMTTLDVLAEARGADMSMSVRIRHRGCANGLNRATVNMQNALNKRLACEVPVACEPPPAADAERSGTELQGTGTRFASVSDPRRSRLGIEKPYPAALAGQDRQLWAGAMMDTLKQIGLAVRPGPDG